MPIDDVPPRHTSRPTKRIAVLRAAERIAVLRAAKRIAVLRAAERIAVLRAAIVWVGLLVAGLVISAVSAAASPAEPPQPAPTSAAQAKQQAADSEARVAALGARITATETLMAGRRRAAEFAQQDYLHQRGLLADAARQLTRANQEAAAATSAFQQAHDVLAAMVLSDYEHGTLSPTVSMLMSSTDPGSLLEAAQLRMIADANRAEVATRADAAHARMDLAKRRAAAIEKAQAAVTAKAAADATTAADQLSQASAAEAQLKAELVQARTQQALAASVAQAWASIGHSLTLAQELQASSQFQARAAQLKAVKVAAPTGHWTPEVAASAVRRAMAWVGLPYSWAGGDAQGPTLGQCSGAQGGGGIHDCSVWGFDCSGLTLYAWAPYLTLAHFAAQQYRQAGAFHPTPDQLLPGDLLFWSIDGTEAGIEHTGLYVGGGVLIQAPESGETVRLTPLAQMRAGYFGATRPLTG